MRYEMIETKQSFIPEKGEEVPDPTEILQKESKVLQKRAIDREQARRMRER